MKNNNSSLAAFSRSMSAMAIKHTPTYTLAVVALSVAVTLVASSCWDMEENQMSEFENDNVWKVRDLDKDEWWSYEFDLHGFIHFGTKDTFESEKEARDLLDSSYKHEGGDSIPNRLEIIEYQLCPVTNTESPDGGS